MKLTIKQSLELCDWLIERGLGLPDCFFILTHIEDGESFGSALFNLFSLRTQVEEEFNEIFNDDNSV